VIFHFNLDAQECRNALASASRAIERSHRSLADAMKWKFDNIKSNRILPSRVDQVSLSDGAALRL